MAETTLKRQYKEYCERITKYYKPGTKPVGYELWKRLHLQGLS